MQFSPYLGIMIGTHSSTENLILFSHPKDLLVEENGGNNAKSST